MVIIVSANTNGFNYSSDYQGHNGVHVIILVFLFFGLLAFGASMKKDVPDNSYNNDYNGSYNNDYNGSYNNDSDDRIEENVDVNDNVSDDNNVIDDSSVIDNNEESTDNGIVDHGYFELVQ